MYAECSLQASGGHNYVKYTSIDSFLKITRKGHLLLVEPTHQYVGSPMQVLFFILSRALRHSIQTYSLDVLEVVVAAGIDKTWVMQAYCAESRPWVPIRPLNSPFC